MQVQIVFSVFLSPCPSSFRLEFNSSPRMVSFPVLD